MAYAGNSSLPLAPEDDAKKKERLFENLDHEDKMVRYQAVIDLERWTKASDPQAIDHVIKALDDSNFLVRIAATRNLSPLVQAKNDKAIEAFVTLYDKGEKDKEVRSNIIEALSLAELVAAENPKVMEVFYKAVGDEAARMCTYTALGRMAVDGDARATSCLIKALDEVEGYLTTRGLLEILAKVSDAGNSQATVALLKALDQDDNLDKKIAVAPFVAQLAGKGNSQGLEAILKTLDHSEGKLRIAAAKAMGHVALACGNTQAKDALSKLVDGKDLELSMLAIQTLEGIAVQEMNSGQVVGGKSQAIEVIFKALEHNVIAVKMQALAFMSYIAGRALGEGDVEVTGGVSVIEATDSIKRLVDDPDCDVCKAALTHLGGYECEANGEKTFRYIPGSGETLIKAFDHPHEDARIHAIQMVLGTINSRAQYRMIDDSFLLQAIQALTKKLEDVSSNVRPYVVDALGSLAFAPTAAEAVFNVMDGNDDSLKKVAAARLQWIAADEANSFSGKALQTLIESCDAKNSEVKASAFNSLCQLTCTGNQKAIDNGLDAVITGLGDQELRVAAFGSLDSLARAGNARAFDAIVSMAQQDDGDGDRNQAPQFVDGAWRLVNIGKRHQAIMVLGGLAQTEECAEKTISIMLKLLDDQTMTYLWKKEVVRGLCPIASGGNDSAIAAITKLFDEDGTSFHGVDFPGMRMEPLGLVQIPNDCEVDMNLKSDGYLLQCLVGLLQQEDPRAISALSKALDDKDEQLKLWVVLYLGEAVSYCKGSRELLKKACDDTTSEAVSKQAKEALQSFVGMEENVQGA